MEAYRKFYKHVANTWGPQSIPVQTFLIIVQDTLDGVPGFHTTDFGVEHFPFIPPQEFTDIMHYFAGDGSNVLDLKCGMYEGEGEDRKLHELPLRLISDWIKYREKGNDNYRIYNPETGTQIKKFETEVFLWFQQTPEFLEMIEEIKLLDDREQVLHELRNDVNKEIMAEWERLGGLTPYETPLNKFLKYEDQAKCKSE
jgi:hypothetical protein